MTQEQNVRRLTLEELYTPTPENEQLEQEMEQSLHPRGMEMLLDMAGEVGLHAGSKVIDVGCGYAYSACQLVERFNVQLLAIDIVPSILAAAIDKVKEAGLEAHIKVQNASIHDIPVPSKSYDFIWCRDMLNHVHPLVSALRECYRVLRPGGAMLVYQTFAGELLESREAERLYQAVGIVSENMSTEYAENAFTAAGFHILKKDVIASEWREHEVERGERTTLEGLLRAARLLRNRQSLVERYGEGYYEQALGDAQWYAFIMLGKLMPVAYLLRR